MEQDEIQLARARREEIEANLTKLRDPSLAILPDHFIWQPVMRRGGGSAFRVGVLRRGYDGEITLTAEGLPEGIVAAGRVPAGTRPSP